MKIKARPEDFAVEEILDATPASRGDFGLYILEKKNENTVELLEQISRRLRLPFETFAWGGRKDKHGLTRQYISIRGRKPFKDLKEVIWSLQHVGFLDRPMGPDLIKANRFSISIRDLTQEEAGAAQAAFERTQEDGFVNYFDDQRFGSFDKTQGFFAEKILKTHYNGALKIHLTRASSEDNREGRERKKFLYDNWGKWPACLERSATPFEKEAFQHLCAKPKDFVFSLRKISRPAMALYFSAYQAYLWNEIARRIIRKKITDVSIQKGVIGDYVFYNILRPEERPYWANLRIPTAASKMPACDEELGLVLNEVFRDNGLRKPQFNITKLRQAYFKSNERPVVAMPQQGSAQTHPDEIYAGKHKLCLGFLLPAGSFATMLVKRLFA